jgi:GrpB-like predicted nucleotidyltransferase (UPF0157 family)
LKIEKLPGAGIGHTSIRLIGIPKGGQKAFFHIYIKYKPMLITAYDPGWINDFLTLKKLLEEALKNLSFSIEHIGSTAVPQLAAKPIIDIDIVYKKDTSFDVIKERLENIGYYHNGNQGIPQREVFKRSTITEKHEILDGIKHHLYVCPADSEELQRHILFRNYLIANEEARIQYQNLKYNIARQANQDKKKYAALKESEARTFINSIINQSTFIYGT